MAAFAGLLLAGILSAPIEASEEAIAQRVGKAFVRDHLIFRPDLSWRDPGEPDCEPCADLDRRPRRYLVWVLRMNGVQMREPAATTVVDDSGQLLAEIIGLPDCKATPDLCALAVDETEALLIARVDHLEAGLEPWSTSLHFNQGYKRFVWAVPTILERDRDGGEEGTMLQIDAVTGEILGRGGWFAAS
jgi:hypothetical protein